MCGIVGYIGNKNAQSIIIDGLEKLEYRGYDSAGIAVLNNNILNIEKCVGGINALKKLIASSSCDGNVGIGHTRWATHGKPSKCNAHPHLSFDGKIAVVHNGIIENHEDIKNDLIKNHGVTFHSETDTEVIAHLISVLYQGDLLSAVHNATKVMKGAYAIGVISTDSPNEMLAVRKDAPLMIGVSDDGNYIASDCTALLKYTNKVYEINNNEIVVLKKDDVVIYDEDVNEVNKEIKEIDWTIESAEKR